MGNLLTRAIRGTALVGTFALAAVAFAAEGPEATVLAGADRDFQNARYDRAAERYRAWLDAHPGDHDVLVKLGWSRYRAASEPGAYEEAGKAFREALDRAPQSVDARIGLAYVALQTRPASESATAFRDVLATDPENQDALRGLALTAGRAGATSEIARAAADAARKRLALEPGDDETALALAAAERLLGRAGELRRRGDTPAGAPPGTRARTGRDYLEVLGQDGSWAPVFVKGVNIGAALPGRFPTEFPYDERTWREWIGTIADLGANAVRAYTLLPPAFYRVLGEHNAAAPLSRRLWLLQGVWTELPERHDFADPAYVDDLRAEIARVVDAVHGDLVLAPRPGHAFGVYGADVSDGVLAWIVGREWEPFAVLDFDRMNPGTCAWRGPWVAAEGGRAMECWVAKVLDFTASYEARRYRETRPMTFANWPTLDPLDHPTEANRLEEEAMRRRMGLPWIESFREQIWDNDAISLDATKIRGTEAFPAGVFASYHIYPNYPDFLNNDAKYAGATDAEGPSRYAGYLRELKAYHGDQPVLVAEFGMSTSRGIAHVQPEGWHHGGHDEREGMRVNARLLRSIRDERMAGGIVFAFQDEWFKGTWSVASFEVPPENRRLWFNAESPEQSYGIVARRPVAPVLVDGDPGDWPASAVVATETKGSGWGAPRSLSVLADEGYLYLLLRTAGGPEPPDWTRTSIAIAIDTYDPGRGERSVGPPWDARTATGVEFLVALTGPETSAIEVTPAYDPAPGRDGLPVVSPEMPAERFAALSLQTNRERIARDGTVIAAIEVERGKLRFGSLDPKAPDFDTRTDVAVGAAHGAIEMRIPWGLLNVADPSSHRVLHQPERHEGRLGTRETDGFRFEVFAASRAEREREVRRLTAPTATARWRWPGWTEPRYRSELKHGVGALRDAFRTIDLGGTKP